MTFIGKRSSFGGITVTFVLINCILRDIGARVLDHNAVVILKNVVPLNSRAQAFNYVNSLASPMTNSIFNNGSILAIFSSIGNIRSQIFHNHVFDDLSLCSLNKKHSL